MKLFCLHRTKKLSSDFHHLTGQVVMENNINFLFAREGQFFPICIIHKQRVIHANYNFMILKTRCRICRSFKWCQYFLEAQAWQISWNRNKANIILGPLSCLWGTKLITRRKKWKWKCLSRTGYVSSPLSQSLPELQHFNLKVVIPIAKCKIRQRTLEYFQVSCFPLSDVSEIFTSSY